MSNGPKPDAEPFARDEHGEKQDASFHEEMLASVEGEIAADYAAIRQAVAQGVPIKDAVASYAGPKTKDWLKAHNVAF